MSDSEGWTRYDSDGRKCPLLQLQVVLNAAAGMLVTNLCFLKLLIWNWLNRKLWTICFLDFFSICGKMQNEYSSRAANATFSKI